MGRTNVYKDDEFEGKVLDGWFYPEKARRYEQDTVWDGQNRVGVITRSNFIDEYLYYTPGGRWVLRHDASRYDHGQNAYTFLTPLQAKDWLLRSEINDDALVEHFGPLEEESGPAVG